MAIDMLQNLFKVGLFIVCNSSAEVIFKNTAERHCVGNCTELHFMTTLIKGGLYGTKG